MIDQLEGGALDCVSDCLFWNPMKNGGRYLEGKEIL